MTIRDCIRLALLSGAAGGSALLSAPVLAQSAGPVLEEIVVTAQRTETSLQQTPVAVTAFSSEALAQKGATSLLDVGNFTPSLSVGSRAGTGTSSGGFSIRGMGVDAQGSSAAVGLYVDEVYFPAAWGNLLGLFDVERIEVLRGPQGTLFGRNTIAGAVQYVTVKPGKEFGGFIEATRGSLDRNEIQGAVNVPIDDTLSVRLSLAYKDNGGYVHDDLNDVERGSERTKVGRLQARWTPTDDLTVDLKQEAMSQHSNGRALEVPGVNPNAQFYNIARVFFGLTDVLDDRYVTKKDWHFSGFNGREDFNFNYQSQQATVAYDLTDAVTLKSISAYTESKSRAYTDLDNSPLSMFAGNRGQLNDDVFTQELQLHAKGFSDRLDLQVGAYYYHGLSTSKGGGFLLGPIQAPNIGTETEIRTVSKALYGQGTFKFTDQLSATLGLRYSKEDLDGQILNTQQVSPAALAAGAEIAKTSKFSNTSPHVGINFQATDDFLLYAKASKGFRAGGAAFDTALGVVPFDPETAWTYEIGARMEFMDRRLRVNPTIFYTDWKDIQFNYLIPTFAINNNIAVVTQNAGDAEMKGAELEVQFAATDNLLLTASASYLDAKYTRLANGLDNTPGLDRNIYPDGWTTFNTPNGPVPFPITTLVVTDLGLNDELMRSPKYKYSIGGRYTVHLATGGSIIPSLDYAWTDKQLSAVTRGDAFLLPAYGVLNGRLRYEAASNKWNLSLYGNNLTNEHYYIGGAGFGKGYTVGLDEEDPGRPREYGVTLGLRF